METQDITAVLPSGKQQTVTLAVSAKVQELKEILQRCFDQQFLVILDNFTVETHDVVAAYPDVLVHYVKKQAPVLMTRRFLLHVVQLFYDRLNSRATRRALVEQICGNTL